MLRIEHLTKHYKGSSKGVTDLSLHIAPGDIYFYRKQWRRKDHYFEMCGGDPGF